MKTFLLSGYMYLSIFLFLAGCVSEDKKSIENADSIKTSIENEEKMENKEIGFSVNGDLLDTYMQIPAPDEIFAYLKNEGVKYTQSNLLKPENLEKYLVSRTQSLAFGIYSADLSYVAAFEDYQTSLKFFSALRKLGDKIGISSVFDESLVKRIQNNLNNIDSLAKISNDSYFGVIDYLMRIENGKTLVLISSGGWVESLYLLCSMVDKYDQKNKVVSRIADQKLVLENLMKSVNKFKDDSDFQELIKHLESLKSIFDKLQVESIQSAPPQKKGAKIVLKGGNKTILNNNDFIALKKQITIIRNTISENK